MENLIQTGLLGRGLIQIKNATLIERYNACLEDIGLTPTKLKKFHIDGWGWSPEIADEKQNKFYLSHFGAANPYAIILTPLQEDRPIYFQYHSFDRDLMRIVFRTFRNQIADLTTETAVWIDVDQEVIKYDKPQDLLMIDSVILRFKSVNNVIGEARNQRELVRLFYDDDHAWNDPKLHDLIIKSCQKYGDLRFRSLDILDIPYTHVRSFYTKAFDNVFVFRDLPGKKPMLIFTDNDTSFSGDEMYDHLEFGISDERLVEKLYAEFLIKLDVNYFIENIDELKSLQICLLADQISQLDEDADLSNLIHLSQHQVIQLLNEYDIDEDYYELDKIIKRLERGKTIEVISKRLRFLLSRPLEILPKMTKITVNQLLVHIDSTDTYRLFASDKELFYKEYATWPENKRAWARAFIKEIYQPHYSNELNVQL